MDCLMEMIRDLRPGEKGLVFCRTKRGCEDVHNVIRDRTNLRGMSIHGDKEQREREQALHLFKRGDIQVLIATDVAQRGLDIPNVNLVINYDMAGNEKDYIHRIGRTGRAGRSGVAVTFWTRADDRLSREIADVLREAGKEVPPQLAGGGGGYGGQGGQKW
ncbi:hypothetical protein KIPB_005130 [Kipferlia bialata]|uniref:Helicase C-terminal domain-containing protein n=1 Tax=Kipferlia bialata TaxID=797122 RepID=A0A9K3GIP5_9EUKA|nr:hypothetical protein KIPB_005130 [Kipferlia bialata]|eukprot:g5130.t1